MVKDDNSKTGFSPLIVRSQVCVAKEAWSQFQVILFSETPKMRLELLFSQKCQVFTFQKHLKINSITDSHTQKSRYALHLKIKGPLHTIYYIGYVRLVSAQLSPLSTTLSRDHVHLSHLMSCTSKSGKYNRFQVQQKMPSLPSSGPVPKTMQMFLRPSRRQ